jgi:hypothetical protein
MMKKRGHRTFETLQVNEMTFLDQNKVYFLYQPLTPFYTEILQISYQKVLSVSFQMLIHMQNQLQQVVPVLLMMISRSSSANLMP